MLIRLIRPATLGLAFLLGAAGSVVLASSCAQPAMNCTSAHGAFAAEYTLTSGDPDSACGQLEGDILGIETYFQPGGLNETPNYEDAVVAIRPQALAELIIYAEAREVIETDEPFYDANAIGPFTSGFPGDAGFCQVEQFEAAEVSLPEIMAIPDDPETEEDESQPAQPAIEVRYEWSDARFLVTADAQGTQFEADLVYERDGCRAEYHVVGLYPAVACETEEDCGVEDGRINPDFAVRCNTELGLCMLDDELPAYEESQ